MTPRVFLAVMIALGAAVAAAPQVRDPGGTPQIGAGVIIGTVMTDETPPQPARRATVTLGGGGLRTARQTVSDNAGRYALTDLPVGSFSLSASKPSFISINYGAPQPLQSGTPIVLGAGQRFTANLKLMRGGVLSGTVTDQYGRPRSNIRIQVLQSRTMGGQRRWLTAGTSAMGSTDDRGAYRVYGLAPGNYVVTAIQQNTQEVRLVTADEVRWVQQEPPSSMVGGAAGASGPPPPAPGPAVGFAPVYYPGAPDLASATMITIGPGEERSGLDFQMQPVPAARLEGLVTDPEGRPAQQPQVSILTAERLTTQLPISPPSSVRIDQATGKFTITGVTPGRYVLTARSTIRPPAPPPEPGPPPPGGRAGAPAGPGRAGGAPGPAPPPSPVILWAMTQIDVSGQDIGNINLALQAGLSISGRLVFEASTLPAPADLTRVRINLSSSEPGPFNQSVPGVAARTDGTFILTGALPGRYRLSPSAPPAPGPQGGPWVVKSILANGRDVLDSGLEVGGESLSGFVITFTDRVTELAGSLLDPAGAPTRNLSVMLFTTDRAFWTPQSRRVRTTMPNQDGKFRFASMPPGEYYLIAVTEADQIDLTDAPGLEQIAAAAIRITLAEGEKKIQDLKVAK